MIFRSKELAYLFLLLSAIFPSTTLRTPLIALSETISTFFRYHLLKYSTPFPTSFYSSFSFYHVQSPRFLTRDSPSRNDSYKAPHGVRRSVLVSGWSHTRRDQRLHCPSYEFQEARFPLTLVLSFWAWHLAVNKKRMLRLPEPSQNQAIVEWLEYWFRGLISC